MGAIGRVLQVAAVVFACGGTGFAVALGLGRWATNERTARAAERLVLRLAACSAAATISATAVLGAAFAREDFALAYVADNARRGVAVPYRVSGIWGGMAGSLLLWTTLLTAVAVVAIARTQCDTSGRSARGRTAAILLGLVSAFGAIGAIAVSPFVVLQIPATDGGGLVPILEHPAMLHHPPLLYLGLVVLAAPYATTLARASALGRDGLDRSWAASARAWTLVAWSLITFGLLAGANWAYVELGWGGYWAWDPIENGALLPWLAATAALHQLTRRTPAFRSAAGFVVLAFVLSVLGALVTRSGAAQSVHAFGQDPVVGRSLLAVFLVVLILALVLTRSLWTGARADRRSALAAARALDRSTLLSLNALLLLATIAIVTIGVVAPIARGWSGGEVVSIEGAYYARLVAPLVWLALVLLAATPRRLGIGWGPAPVVVGALAVTAVTTALGMRAPAAITTIVLGTAALLASLGAIRTLRPWAGRATRARASGYVVHLGFALLLVGIGGSAATVETTRLLGPGDRIEIDGIAITAEGAVGFEGTIDEQPRIIAPVVVQQPGSTQRLEPMIVGYPAMGVRLAETGMTSNPLRDVQVALRTAEDDGAALYDIRVRPLAPLVWWGGLVMIAGGVALLVSRHRASPDETQPVTTIDTTAIEATAIEATVVTDPGTTSTD